MLVFEFKIKAKEYQYQKIDESVRTGQFIRNKCIRLWLDSVKEDKVSWVTLNKYTKVLADDVEFPFASKLNSMARQASAERAWFAISRFYDNCKKKITGKKGFPQFKKNSRSIEYKTCGWKLSEDKKYLTITDKTEVGRLKLLGSVDLNFYQIKQIKRVRLLKKADGYYAQFCVDQDRVDYVPKTGSLLGIDVGLESFLTDSNGEKIDNPRFLRKSEKKLKKLQRKLSKKVKGSNNRKKAQNRLGRKHLKISNQRKDFAIKLARCVMISNDIVVIEDLQVRNMIKNPKLAKSISDASWSMFRNWLTYFSKIFDKELIAVNPQYTSQKCSSCEEIVRKSLSTRTHVCNCGCVLDRDHNAAINILNKGLSIAGSARINALGQNNQCVVSENLQDKLTG